MVAWYADRPSIWLPQSDGKVAELRNRFKVRWLFLTDKTGEYPTSWQILYYGLSQWNVAYVRAEAAKTILPTTVQITNQQQPLLKSLEGFATVAPMER